MGALLLLKEGITVCLTRSQRPLRIRAPCRCCMDIIARA